MEDIEHLIEKPYKKRETRENKPERRDERRERDSRHRHSPYSREPPRNYYKEREERITENRSSVSHSRKSSNDRYSPSVPQPVLSDIERDARTVFVTQLALKLSKYELLDFFSKAGPVRDCTIVYDKVTGRSKGVGYVEFVDPLSVPEALLLNGHRLLGIPCSVQASGAEKNYKGDDHLAAVAIMSAVNPILPEYDHSFKKLYVGSIHYSISESDLISLFEPFGELESLKLLYYINLDKLITMENQKDTRL